MLSINYVRFMLRLMVILMWLPMPILAATIIRESPPVNEFGFINWTFLALAFGISTLSGAAALAWRFDKELAKSADGKLPRPWLFAISNMLGSLLAGVFAWLMAQSLELDYLKTLSSVLLLSFGGARAIEMILEKYINRDDGKGLLP